MAGKQDLVSQCLGIFIFTILLMLGLPSESGTLPATQTESLLRLAKLLGTPPALSSWNPQTDFCNLPPSPFVNISCREGSLAALQIVGDRISAEPKLHANAPGSNPLLSENYIPDDLTSTLLKFPALEVLSLVSLGLWGDLPAKLDHLPSLKVLNLSSNLFSGSLPLRFSSLKRLEVLALDNNAISGPFPEFLNALITLKTLHLSNNQLSGSLPPNLSPLQNLNSLLLDDNLLTGSLPSSLADLTALQTLSLSRNHLSGKIPNLSLLKVLENLDLADNTLGPEFPMLGEKLVELLLRNNKLQGALPSSLGKLSSIKVLDLSTNALSGSLPETLLVVPTLRSLNLSNNRLTGNLSYNLRLGGSLNQLDLSSNFFTGTLPHLFEKPEIGRNIQFQRNCFNSRSQQQLPLAYCQSVEIKQSLPHRTSNVALLAGVIGGICLLAAIFLTLLVILVIYRRRRYHRRKGTTHHGTSSCTDSASLAVPSELLTQARYLSQSIRLGVHGAPQNRVFSMHELKDATNNFSEAAYVGEGQLGKVYKGRLENGSVVCVKFLLLDGRPDLKQLKSHIEILAKLRHKNLVSLIGHCIEKEPDEQKHVRLFLVSEFIDNGTLRSHLQRSHQPLNWSRRLAAAVGAGKAIQYLHTGVVPGIFNNDVKITNILLDHNLVAKASDFGLSGLVHDLKSSVKLPSKKLMPQNDLDAHRRKMLLDKMDVYNFGLVLLEIVMGRPPMVEYSTKPNPTIKEMDMLQLEGVSRLDLVDPSIRSCMHESLATVLEIAAKCLLDNPAFRPSMEDVLWNLQYAAQVQDKVSGNFQDDYPTYYLPG